MASKNLIIRTKLFPPTTSKGVLVRPDLDNALTGSGTAKILLVHAPAGYGKTTLLCQWYKSMLASEEPICWLSLDELDDNPTSFLRYLLFSFRETVEHFWPDGPSWIDGRLQPDLTIALNHVINELVRIRRPLTLFIDDYQHIQSPALHKFVERLVDWSPPNFRLVIGSRIIPTLPVSRWRVSELIVEVDVGMLRFNSDEVSTFLAFKHELELTSEQIETINQKSEGWAAGLQLVALVLKNHPNRSDFIASFSGNLSEISDYLTSNVLDRQPAPLREFLLKISILSRFNAELCDLLTDRTDSIRFLEQLEADGLFTLRLDEREHWYRFHHLFHDFLAAKLRSQYPHEISGLYRIASEWFRAKGLIREAVDYALLGDNFAVIEDIHRDAIAIMSLMGTSAQVYTWLNGIPDAVKDRFPRLLILEGFALCLMNRVEDAETVNARINLALNESTLDEETLGSGEIEAIAVEAALVPAAIAAMRDDNQHLLNLTQRLDQTSTDSLMVATLKDLRGYALIRSGQFDLARNLLADAAHYFTQNQQSYGMAVVYGFLGVAEIQCLRLKDAYRLFEIAEDAARNPETGNIFARGLAGTMRAVVCYEWNRIEEAQSLLNSSLPLIEEVGAPIFSCYGYIALSRCYSAMQEWDSANNALSRCLHRSRHCISNLYPEWVERERLLLQQRMMDSGVSVRAVLNRESLEQVSPPETWDYGEYYRLTNEVRRGILSSDIDRAERVLKAARSYAERHGVSEAILDASLLDSKLRDLRGDKAGALRVLGEALTLAQPAGSLRAFADEGAPMRQLLVNWLHLESGSGDLSSYTRDILNVPATLSVELTDSAVSNESSDSSAGFVEALSHRELEVLQLVSAGKTNLEIADQLHIAKATVKFHLSNIFSKLGATNRTLAVATARGAGLIS
jgi:LuxR family maltose regulon positive regulatory protein